MNFAGILDQRMGTTPSVTYTLTVSLNYLSYDLDGVPCDGDTFEITTQAGNSWTISESASWMSCSPTSGSGNRTIVVTVTDGPSEQYADITITSSAPTRTVSVERLISCLG